MQIFDHSVDPESHDSFLRWRQQHPRGFVASRKSRRESTLHFANCSHLLFVSNSSARMTKRMKVCSTDHSEIDAWASENEQILRECRSCKPYG